MTCFKCGLDVASDDFVCRCGWRRTITSCGKTSVLLPGIREQYRWENVPNGCLLILAEKRLENE
jgi:hypothetical protein